MKEIGLSRPKWTLPGWPSLAFGGATTGAMPREWHSSQVDHHCRGTARVTATSPVDDVH